MTTESILQNQLVKSLKKIPEGARTRFAPSPTGHLHAGHVVNLIFVWGIARAVNGTVVCRVEDHDVQRCRPEYIEAILGEMELLGFVPDEGMTVSENSDFYLQSSNTNRYLKFLDVLIERGMAYECSCTRKEIMRLNPENVGELHYPGHCRNGVVNSDAKGRILRVHLPDKSISYTDLLHGETTQVPARQCGDFSIRDRCEQWTYQFACVCDDIVQDINLVIRGEDLKHSSGRQILTAELLGRSCPPLFLHHPLIRDERGRKLSKRFHAESISSLLKAGKTPAEIIGDTAFHCGLSQTNTPMSADQAIGIFKELAGK